MRIKRLQAKQEQVSGVTFLTLSGYVDAANADELEEALAAACVGPEPCVVVDCEQLEYLNSTSFGLFFKFCQQCEREGGRLVACNVKDKISNLMDILGLNKYLDICEGRQTAVARMG